MSARTTVLADKLAALEARRATFERDIALLSGNPHPDLVEEAARRLLGYAYPQTKLVNTPR